MQGDDTIIHNIYVIVQGLAYISKPAGHGEPANAGCDVDYRQPLMTTSQNIYVNFGVEFHQLSAS